MKTTLKIIIISLIFSCSKTQNLGEGFYLDYDNVSLDYNIYYKSEAIFRNMCCNSVGYNNSYIIAKIFDFNEGLFSYCLINKLNYAKDYGELENTGVEWFKTRKKLFEKLSKQQQDLKFTINTNCDSQLGGIDL